MLIAEHWIPAQSELFNVVIQCGAVLAVLLVFSKRVWQLLTGAESARRTRLSSQARRRVRPHRHRRAGHSKGPDSPSRRISAPSPWATLVGGGLILGIEFLVRGKPAAEYVTWSVALAVAGAQLLAAACPGTSRSGATILFAMMLGLSRTKATEFSFLVGIPTMFAAGAYEIHHELKHAPAGSTHWSLVWLGTAVAAVTAFVAVKWLLRYVQSHTFNPFGWYRIVLGAAIFALLLR